LAGCRAGLQDAVFVEAAGASWREGKAILRKVFEDLIPVENQRIAKKGFNVPLRWMRTKLDRFFDEYLPAEYVRKRVFSDLITFKDCARSTSWQAR
jgi:hypothetical protein